MARGRVRGGTPVAARVGRTLLMIGALLVTFVAYQLWGTALYEHHAQDRLRTQLEAKLHHRVPSVAPAATRSGGAAADPAGTPGGGADNAVVPSAAALAASAQAPPEGSSVGFLSIPRMGMSDTVIVEGVNEPDLQQGPGHYPGTPLPGQAGNVAIAGHRTTYGAPFYNLDQLQPGDPITVQVPQGTFRYQVVESVVVSPDDVSVINPRLPLPLLTLTTCNPRFSATQRLVVVALLQKSQAPPVAAGAPPPRTSTSTTPSTTVARSTTVRASVAAHRAAHRAARSTFPAGGPTGSVGGAIAWGAYFLLALVGLRLFRRHLEWPLRQGAYAAGVVGVLVVLFVFFEHVSVALPSSF